jgi:glycosyltransferase involved in cell wall biosynthesis
MQRGITGYIQGIALLWAAVLRARMRFEVAFAVDNLNTVACLPLRGLRLVDRVVFYTIDVVPERFSGGLLTRVYNLVERHAARRADLVWILTPEMSDARRALGRIGPRGAAPELVVPMGCRFHGPNPKGATTSTIAYVGTVLEHHGLQLAIRALPRIRVSVPDAQLRIIGTGPYQEALETLVEDMGLGDYVDWTGYVEDPETMLDLLAECALGVAPYDASIDPWTRYADPGKVKAYLACGLPVVLTAVPPIATELEGSGCAIVVPYDVDAFAGAVVDLLSDRERLGRYRRNAAREGERFDWTAIFDKALESMPPAIGSRTASRMDRR